jgi:CSLREA domain-containing protein
LLGLCPALGTPPTVSATAPSFSVTTFTDAPDAHPGDGVCATGAGPCSLRAAVQEADAQPRGTSSVIIVPSGTYTLTLGALVIRNTVVISGAGSATTQLIGHNDRVLVVAAGTRAAVSGVTLSGGNAGTGVGGGVVNLGLLVLSESTLSANTAWSGGGLYNGPSAWLAVVNSTLEGNVVTASGSGLVNDGGSVTLYGTAVMSNTASYGDGGGIYNSGTLTVTNSTVSGNAAGGGGGINNSFGATVTVTSSTISGNSAPNGGGGIYNSGMLTVSNSTLSGNSTLNGGGGIYNFAGTLALSYVTVAANSSGLDNDTSGGPATLALTGTIVANSTSGLNCVGPMTENQGYNLDSGTTCGFARTTDITGTDPLLGPLANNGGPTPTMALLPGSPAIDHGGTAANSCPATDQRGVARPQGPACDMGSFEVEVAIR